MSTPATTRSAISGRFPTAAWSFQSFMRSARPAALRSARAATIRPRLFSSPDRTSILGCMRLRRLFGLSGRIPCYRCRPKPSRPRRRLGFSRARSAIRIWDSFVVRLWIRPIHPCRIAVEPSRSSRDPQLRGFGTTGGSDDEASNDYWVRGCRPACCCRNRCHHEVARALDRRLCRLPRHDYVERPHG
jgi:hypothetical protein